MQPESSSTQHQDLDAFLTVVESKLRTPFSSLDFAKAAATGKGDYLDQICKVFPRMEKAVQLRILVGLFGLEPSPDLDTAVWRLLELAQESDEEWVRIIAGLVRGKLFRSSAALEESEMRGSEAQTLLEKTCEEVLKQVVEHNAEMGEKREKAANEMGLGIKEDDSQALQSLLLTDDVDPLFAPYRFSLLSPATVKRTIPECDTNPHFVSNAAAEILHVDAKLEETKAQEERELEKQLAQQRARASKATAKSSVAKLTAIPGHRSNGAGAPSAATTGKKPERPKPEPSLFIRSKKPVAGTARGRLGRGLGVPSQRKTPLAGRTQGAAAAAGQRPGRVVGKFAAKSKMKLLDVSEVQGLTKEHKERDDKLAQKLTMEQKRRDRKRKVMETAEAMGLRTGKKWGTDTQDTDKKQKVQEATPTAPPPPTKEPAPAAAPAELAVAAAALSTYQQQAEGGSDTSSRQQQAASLLAVLSGGPSPAAASPAAPKPAAPAPPGGDWHQLLEQSNRLTPEDRRRIELFFVERVNPHPEEAVSRIKLHEEKSQEPGTGAIIKETLYLELDYNTFGFKKLRKVKRK